MVIEKDNKLQDICTTTILKYLTCSYSPGYREVNMYTRSAKPP